MSKQCDFLAFMGFCVVLAWSLIAVGAEPLGAASADRECGTLNVLRGRSPMPSGDLTGNRALGTDERVAEEGTDWDAPSSIILETRSASLVYDLGIITQVGAVYLQADANDTYTIWGTDNAEPEGFRMLAQLPNVVDRGPGLRDRVIQFSPGAFRYLRVSVGEGDDAYSISEFAAYCRAPTPFPPNFPKMGAAARPIPSLTAPTAASSATGTYQSVWLKLSGVLAALGLALAIASRSNRDSNADRERAVANRSRLAHRVLCLLFFASGCAALIYEVVWMHLLRLVIGASATSVAIVLASFMGGMFLGSLLFARLVRPNRNPIVIYAVLEVGIGVFGLLMPAILPAAKYVYIGLFGYGPLGITLRAVIAAIMLLPPTALMGATLPAIARRYKPGRRGMASLTSLYAVNTLGAVAGCLLSAFLLLAFWDVWVATVTAAVLNFGIGAVAWLLRAKLFADTEDVKAIQNESTRPAGVVDLGVIYLAAAISGLTALGAQVIWTRLLTLLFGASVYAFAIILAVFLAGLGIGSAWASSLVRRGADSVRGLALSQFALIPTMLLGGYLLAEALPYGSPPGWIPMQALHLLHIVRAVVVVLPATIFWGMSFPFALAAAGNGNDDVGRSTGRVYASNTIGAIIGAVATSFWLIPSYGTHRSGQVLLFASAIAGAVLTASLRKAAANGKAKRPFPMSANLASYLLPLSLGALGVGLLPAFPKEFLAHGRYLVWLDKRDVYPYVSEGAASTVAVHVAPDGYSNFHVSGRVEATNNPNDLRTERLIGHISAFAHPHPESVLVVGLGAGVTAGALTLHPEIKRIVICEIEPRVVGATSLFAKENHSVLTNPRVQLVFDDARHFLATTREKFDIITSDPIHPWVRGNSILFSREYYAIVKAHLKPGGLASQWVPLYETSELAIQIQAQTFVKAFADGTVWNTITNNRGYDVVFVGANEPLRIVVEDVQARIERSPALEASLREVKLGSAQSLLSTYGTNGRDMGQWLTDVPVNRDFSLKLEYISGLAMNSHQADEIYARMIANRKLPERLFVAEPDVLASLGRRILSDANP